MGEKKQPTGKQALYRRYRSASFDEVVGQEHVTDLLATAVKNGGVSHAYLFTGPKGTGKTSVARILAFAINNIPYEHDAQHLDIIEIDAASNRRIDDIRDLREKVHIAPSSAPYKVYIIDEVHMLTGESFNALLKTLEEPPAHAIFILATTELHKVPATIVSRTQRFHFRPIARDKVVAHLKDIAKKEKINIDQSALEIVADHGGGSFRDSISLLDQLGSLEKPITAEVVESIVGRASVTRLQALLDSLKEHDETAVRKIVSELDTNGLSPVTLAEQLVKLILTQPDLSSSWYVLVEKLMEIPRAHFPQLLLMTHLLSFAKKGSPRAAAQTVSAPPKEVIQEAPVIIAMAPAPEPVPTPKPVKVAKASGTFDWDAVLTAAQKNHAPLHSVLARATMSYDGDTLTLSFQYALHRKKLEQSQYRTQLAQLIEDVCGCNPKITIQGSTPQVTENDTTRAVADIMGGGDVVSV